MANDRIEIDTGTGELLCEIRDRVALITLNRPEARNALSDHLTPARRLMIKQCGDDPAVLLAMAVNRAYQSAGLGPSFSRVLNTFWMSAFTERPET
jgi:hypothetical protein